ncbi:hypothetical protein GOBAR_DD19338 [Gossypium barbadense]|nr:hypothetical protein GOBAR_DD19338 [Gossypium barbadense]
MGEHSHTRTTTKRTEQSLVFAVNGERFELFQVDPSTTLLEFLRCQTSFKSPKLGCGEGGCGACVVLLSKYDPFLDKVEDFTLRELEIARMDSTLFRKGSVVSMLLNVVIALQECNLCRCTGYRPIVDACKTFATDVDMEDLGLNSFWRKGECDEVKLRRLPPYSHGNGTCVFPEFLKNKTKAGFNMESEACYWYSPVSLQQLQRLLQMDDENNETSRKIVVSNTGMGYYKELIRFNKYIDLRYIPELSIIKKDHTGTEIGAAVTISKAIETLKEANEPQFSQEASIGGNLMMAQRKHFPSDIATILLSVDAMVDILTDQRHESIMLEEFLGRPPLDSKSVLLAIKIPCWRLGVDISSQGYTKLLFETYRAAPRPIGNALPYMNSAFLAEVSLSRAGIMLNHCRLTFGAYGTKHAIRARNVEEFLSAKFLNTSVLYEAIKILEITVVPEDGTSHPAYQLSLAIGFLFDFLYPLLENPSEISSFWSDGDNKALPFSDFKGKQDSNQLDQTKFSTLLSSAKQVVQLSEEYNPVGEPIKKVGATLQASGEAVYVDDIPSPSNCLHGAFIYSTEPLAWVKDIEFKPGSSLDGVIKLISSKDIPGENIGAQTMFGSEPLYADKLTECAGQRIALVVADTQRNADMAANLAVINYDKENLDPILSVEKAFERCGFFEVPSSLYPEQVGDFYKGMAEADHQIHSAEIKLGSQYYFYMETQAALAVPDEDNCMIVYSSTQWPELTHGTIAKCLGVPGHNVRVITRRVGGGFGGKAVKAMPVSTACALAAYKLQRPVRMYVNRQTDMIMAGGRHPMKITYSVGFKGISVDISPLLPNHMFGSLRKYNWGALAFDIKVCKTNRPSRSSMRAPGEVQGSFIAEAIIENVASILSLDVDSVRSINLHNAGEPLEYTLPSIWNKLGTSSSFYHRVEILKQFNRCNKWRKRGISRVPIVHEVTLKATSGKVSILYDGSIVVEVGGIELGQGLWTKVKQMTAYALSLIQCGGIDELLEKVRVIQTDTLSLIQGGSTSGSTTSESSCEAVRRCCDILVERLTAFKERLVEQMGSIKWETLILQAYNSSVNLSAISLYVPDISSLSYLNYGAAVEIDVLTGQTTILQTDIIYDCGQSLNPAVDLGQIEGAFVQGIGFFMLEEYPTNSKGLVTAEGTWTYKIPTVDTIPKQFNVEILNSGHHKHRVLSSKGKLGFFSSNNYYVCMLVTSGEPPLTLAVSVHCAIRAAIKEAREQLHSWGGDESSSTFKLEVPAIMPVVKELCGLDSVQRFLQWTIGS